MRGFLALARACNGCGKVLVDYHGQMMRGEVICHSIVFGASDDIELCRKCSDNEMIEEEKKGTNDLPDLLKLYETMKN